MRHPLKFIAPCLFASCVYAQGLPQTASAKLGRSSIEPVDLWSHFAGNPRRQSRPPHTSLPPSLGSPSWINSGNSTTIYTPIAQAGIVVDQHQLYTIARDLVNPGSCFGVCYDRTNGEFLWATPIPPMILDSWSTPAISIEHQQLIVASSSFVSAIGTIDGALNWSTDIGSVTVNASPIVTNDLGKQDRVFITNYSFGGGPAAMLTCINIDPFDQLENPYQPGEIVWQTPLLGDSSGNTPAYANGVVYVSTASSQGSQAGQIHAFDATSPEAPTPNWTFTNTINAGFYSGISIAGNSVYASSYNFYGLQSSANTVKIDRSTGIQIWSIPTNRTDSTPIVLPNGDVIVSGGLATGAFDFLPFYGSLPSIQYIADNNNAPIMLWDSALDTLIDTNTNGIWDFGEPYLSIGGWTHQPIALTIGDTPALLVGTLPETTPGVQFGHGSMLSLIDLTKHPTEPAFIVDQYIGAGSTPAVAGSWIYTNGDAGVHAFSQVSLTPPTPSRLIEQFSTNTITLDQLVEQLSK